MGINKMTLGEAVEAFRRYRSREIDDDIDVPQLPSRLVDAYRVIADYLLKGYSIVDIDDAVASISSSECLESDFNYSDHIVEISLNKTKLLNELLNKSVNCRFFHSDDVTTADVPRSCYGWIIEYELTEAGLIEKSQSWRIYDLGSAPSDGVRPSSRIDSKYKNHIYLKTYIRGTTRYELDESTDLAKQRVIAFLNSEDCPDWCKV